VTGFAPLVRGIIRDRSGGVCEVQVVCQGIAAVQQHHRRGRFMGGTKRPETDLPANGLAICVPCHHYITTDHRTESYEKGWLVSQSADPALVPVLYRGTWVKLDNVGDLRPMEGMAHG
jgi:5-methylcytosine-specific restriction protein A